MAVSNTTPPPATSPVNIKVKSEPQSPPRDLSGGHQQNSNGSSHTTNNNSNAANGSASGPNNHSNLTSHNLNSSLSISTHGLGVGGGNVGVIAGTSPGGAGGGGGGVTSGGASNSSSTSNGSANDQATNLSVLNHTQQHLVMAGSRPSSTGHLTPTPGMYFSLLMILIFKIFFYYRIFLKFFLLIFGFQT